MAAISHPADQTAAAFNPWREVASIGAILMEMTWLVLVYQGVSPFTAADPTLNVYIFFVTFGLFAIFIGRLTNRVRLVRSVERVTLLVLYGLGYLLGSLFLLQIDQPDTSIFTTSLRGFDDFSSLIPGEFWLAAALLWTLIRATQLGRQSPGTFAIKRYMRVGIWMFLSFSLLAITNRRELPGFELFIVFITVSLLSLVAARVSILGKLRGGRRNPFTRGWIGSILAGVLLTVGVSLSFAMLTTGRFLIFYQRLVSLILVSAVTLVLSPFIFILSLFGNVDIQPVPEVPQEAQLPPWEEDAGYIPEFEDVAQEQLEVIPEEYRNLITWGAGALTVVLLVIILLSLRMVYERQKRAKVEYVYKRGDLIEQLRRELRSRRKGFVDTMGDGAFLTRQQRIQASEKIRQIYAALLDLSESFDAAREPSQTPLEFQVVLQRALPGAGGEIETITRSYLNIRYGQLPEKQAEVDEVRRAWNKVEKAGLEKAKLARLKQKNEQFAGQNSGPKI
jgi:hypothetical protein